MALRGDSGYHPHLVFLNPFVHFVRVCAHARVYVCVCVWPWPGISKVSSDSILNLMPLCLCDGKQVN